MENEKDISARKTEIRAESNISGMQDPVDADGIRPAVIVPEPDKPADAGEHKRKGEEVPREANRDVNAEHPAYVSQVNKHAGFIGRAVVRMRGIADAARGIGARNILVGTANFISALTTFALKLGTAAAIGVLAVLIIRAVMYGAKDWFSVVWVGVAIITMAIIAVVNDRI